MSLFDLSGKVALVTGSTQGIGRGIAEQLVAQGARVIVTGRTQAASDAAAAEIRAMHGGNRAGAAVGAAFDLHALAEVEAFAAKAVTAFGRLDILVCNAAALPFIGPSRRTPPERFDRTLSSNIHHNYRLCEALRPALAAARGSIVLIGSIAGHSAARGMLAYAVAKAGVAHMARCLAEEYVGEGIRVNCVSPGFIRSHSSAPVIADEAALAQIVGTIPLGRVGEPEDIAGAVIYLCSQAGSYVTGETILVDGGRANLAPPLAPEVDPNAALRAAAERGNG